MPETVTLTHADVPDFVVPVPEGRDAQQFAADLALGYPDWTVGDISDGSDSTAQDTPAAPAVVLPQQPATPTPSKPAKPVDASTDNKES